MITKIRDYIRKKKEDFSLIQYTKRFVTSITIFTMLVILLCIWRDHGKAYSLASTAMTMLRKIGGLYMGKSLIETALEKSDFSVKSVKKLFNKDEEVEG